jgi:predicted dehydrogenase
MSSALNRRQFLQSVAAAAAVGPFLSIPSRADGVKLRHASVGAAGQAFSDLNAFAKHPSFELVAVADVDLCRIEPLQQRFPKVRVYQDWREMLQKERRNIDSVNVSIPDHMHCAVAMEAMRQGKAVYVQKPLCNTLRETRLLTTEARRRRLITQMGIQVSSTRGQRYGEALVRSGIVGKIKEVHTFSNKNWGDDKPLPDAEDPVPAPLGDMGCHIYSPPYRALKLTSPVSVTAYGPAPSEESWATKARVKLTYPGTEYTADKTVDVWWYDGGELPPASLREPVGSRFPQQGSIVVGTDGLLVLPHGNAEPFALPESKMAALPQIELPERDHYAEFVDAVLGGGKTPCSASFEYAGPLTESVLIGNVAAHFSGETLEFDARTLSFPRKPQANQFLTRTYRPGWGIKA